MYIRSLRSYIEALGGELEIWARFPEGDVRINQFKDLEWLRGLDPVISFSVARASRVAQAVLALGPNNAGASCPTWDNKNVPI